jgi:hypothetical protein
MTRPGTGTLVLPEPARRLDWRFLLPSSALGRVGYLGPEHGALPESLRKFSAVFRELEGGREGGRSNGSPEDCDLVVVASRGLRDLRVGLRHLRPGGHLYWEVDRWPRLLERRQNDREWHAGGPRMGGFLRDPNRTLEALGLEAPRLHWHYPGLRRPRAILSSDPAAARFATEIRGRGRFGLERGVILASRLGLLARLVPTFGVVARRPGRKAEGPQVAAEVFLQDTRPGIDLEGQPFVILFPEASPLVISVLLDAESGYPLAVVKAARHPGDPAAQRALDRESNGLRLAARADLPDPGSVPTVIGTGSHGGSRNLGQSGVPGRVLTQKELSGDPERWVEGVVQWLIALHTATRVQERQPQERFRRLVEDPLRAVEVRIPPDDPLASLITRTRVLTSPLGRPDIPSVLEHGDLCGSNVVVSQEGRVAVIDWELADPHGLPGVDLFFFLAHVAMAREKARTSTARLLAFRNAFKEPGGWAWPWISRYREALGLPEDILKPLMATCWARVLRRLLKKPDGTFRSGLESDRQLGPVDLWMERIPPAELAQLLGRHHYARFLGEVVGIPVGDTALPSPHISHRSLN